MRYYYTKPDFEKPIYGQTYICNHPVYDRCTLFAVGAMGLAIIQQRYNPVTKTTYWTEIDSWLTGELYLQKGFREFFDNRAKAVRDGLYPTVTIRQIMWALKMKPLKRERWETCFDRRDI